MQDSKTDYIIQFVVFIINQISTNRVKIILLFTSARLTSIAIVQLYDSHVFAENVQIYTHGADKHICSQMATFALPPREI